MRDTVQRPDIAEAIAAMGAAEQLRAAARWERRGRREAATLEGNEHHTDNVDDSHICTARIDVAPGFSSGWASEGGASEAELRLLRKT